MDIQALFPVCMQVTVELVTRKSLTCGILDLLEPGDEVMADRGFDIESDMPNGVLLNIPPFLDGKPQLTAEDEAKTRKIASARVHVEWAIARIKKLYNAAAINSFDTC